MMEAIIAVLFCACLALSGIAMWAALVSCGWKRERNYYRNMCLSSEESYRNIDRTCRDLEKALAEKTAEAEHLDKKLTHAEVQLSMITWSSEQPSRKRNIR